MISAFVKFDIKPQKWPAEVACCSVLCVSQLPCGNMRMEIDPFTFDCELLISYSLGITFLCRLGFLILLN